MKIIFYEKPGCSGNAKQKELLKHHGVTFETRSMLSAPWSEAELHSFFEGLDKEEIVNKFAPQIKSGEVNVQSLSKDELVRQMIQEPILIKRPLLILGETKVCGFDIEKINQILGTNIGSSSSISTCQSETPCPTPTTSWRA